MLGPFCLKRSQFCAERLLSPVSSCRVCQGSSRSPDSSGGCSNSFLTVLSLPGLLQLPSGMPFTAVPPADSLLLQLLSWGDFFALQPILVLLPPSCLVFLFIYHLHYVTHTPAAPELPSPAFRDHSAFRLLLHGAIPAGAQPDTNMFLISSFGTPVCTAAESSWHCSSVLWRRGVGACPFLLLRILSQDRTPACGMLHGTLVLGVFPVLSLLCHTRLLVESEIKITSLFLAIPTGCCAQLLLVLFSLWRIFLPFLLFFSSSQPLFSTLGLLSASPALNVYCSLCLPSCEP